MIYENNNPTGVCLNTGEVIPCDLIIVATGVRANVKFLEGSAMAEQEISMSDFFSSKIYGFSKGD